MTKRDDRFDRLFDSAEQVLGPIEEMTADDVTEMLEESGIDTDALSRRTYGKLAEVAERYYSKNQDVPVQLAQALNEFRPADAPTSDPETAAQRAKQWSQSFSLRDQVREGLRWVIHFVIARVSCLEKTAPFSNPLPKNFAQRCSGRIDAEFGCLRNGHSGAVRNQRSSRCQRHRIETRCRYLNSPSRCRFMTAC